MAEENVKTRSIFLIDRTELPYDAMVADPSWLLPVREGEEGEEHAEEKQI